MNENGVNRVVRTVVFAESSGGGNPCPVVFGGDFLSPAEMQRMAAEFGVETAFVLSPINPHADFRLRYFVPKHEMEMCVHATVGFATVYWKENSPTASTIQVESPLGIIAVHRIDDSLKPLVMVEQFPPTFAERAPNIESVAEVLNISPTNIRNDIPIQSVSTSRSKLIVPINDVHILHGLKPNFEALWSLCDDYDTTGLYPFVVTEARETLVGEARQFPKRSGYPEDPATGVAASALSAYCVANKLTVNNDKDDWHTIKVHQGRAIGRPSTIIARCRIVGEDIIATQVGGRAEIEN